MVFNATFNNMSAMWWQEGILVEETGEDHKPAASHLQPLSHRVESSIANHQRVSNSQR
jgi:hypothetical protein